MPDDRWSEGPFDNDAACDFVDSLSSLPSDPDALLKEDVGTDAGPAACAASALIAARLDPDLPSPPAAASWLATAPLPSAVTIERALGIARARLRHAKEVAQSTGSPFEQVAVSDWEGVVAALARGEPVAGTPRAVAEPIGGVCLFCGVEGTCDLVIEIRKPGCHEYTVSAHQSCLEEAADASVPLFLIPMPTA